MTQPATESCQENIPQVLDKQPNHGCRVLVVSSIFPSHVLPGYGIFVKERLKAVARFRAHELRVVSPVPYFPCLPITTRWSHWARFPREESIDGLPVVRPRYFMLPKLGGYVEADLMYRPALRAVNKLRASGFRFDLIDAHFIYPNGVVGSYLAEKFDVPLIITGRGEDILRFPQLPIMGRKIRKAIQRADHFIALSREIAQAFERLGAPHDRITVIPNGVDCQKFHPIPQEIARARLGLPSDRRIILSVGNRQELKGFHLLIEALSTIRQTIPDAMLVIVGGRPPYGADHTPVIERTIREHGLEQHVRLVGSRPHDELPRWYNAADVFVLLSSREGSPNVLMEALACGTPAVATPVGGIPDILSDQRLGLLLAERSARSAAEGIIQLAHHPLNREVIREAMLQFDWQIVARKLTSILDQIITINRPSGFVENDMIEPRHSES